VGSEQHDPIGPNKTARPCTAKLGHAESRSMRSSMNLPGDLGRSALGALLVAGIGERKRQNKFATTTHQYAKSLGSSDLTIIKILMRPTSRIIGPSIHVTTMSSRYYRTYRAKFFTRH
jgi:hypothetical protein